MVQARATCAGETPSSSATDPTARATACSRSPTAPASSRAGSPPPTPPGRVYLPDRIPPWSGLHAATDRPNASAMGSSSRSTSRFSRLYGTWSPANSVQPRSSASVLARDTSQAGASETPM